MYLNRGEKEICPMLPHLRWGNFRNMLVLIETLWRSAVVGIQNKLLFVVKNTGNIKENIEKSSKVAPLDNIL